MTLSFRRLAETNATRCRHWHGTFPDPDPGGWSGADWSNAMQGEASEAGNVVKKLRRHELALPGNTKPDDLRVPDLVARLADEIADAIIYADLLATYYGIDLGAAVVSKFNRKSEELGLEERL